MTKLGSYCSFEVVIEQAFLNYWLRILKLVLEIFSPFIYKRHGTRNPEYRKG